MDNAREARETFRVSMNSDGSVMLPQRTLALLGIEDGGELLLEVRDGALMMITREEALRRVQAMFRPWQPGEPLPSEEFIAERRREAARDLDCA